MGSHGPPLRLAVPDGEKVERVRGDPAGQTKNKVTETKWGWSSCMHVTDHLSLKMTWAAWRRMPRYVPLESLLCRRNYSVYRMPCKSTISLLSVVSLVSGSLILSLEPEIDIRYSSWMAFHGFLRSKRRRWLSLSDLDIEYALPAAYPARTPSVRKITFSSCLSHMGRQVSQGGGDESMAVLYVSWWHEP
ncbi:hypothetical protein BR93DRAFT_549471 [Coniochaeta sp. PMI_546]|nr:hypothetical protein BR93DRAFT_549471 [Coniochaeta sp. PMI_546]